MGRQLGACLAVLVADTWRDSQVDLLTRERKRFGFRDVDPTGVFTISCGGGRPKKGAPVQNKNALDGDVSIRCISSRVSDRGMAFFRPLDGLR